MTSPFRRKVEQLAAEHKLPADNWLARRVAGIDGLRPSIQTVTSTVQSIGRLFLDGHISTNLLSEANLDPKNVRPSEDIGHLSLSIRPSLKGSHHFMTSGQMWGPDTAMNVHLRITDQYQRQGQKPEPTGNVRMQMHARTWGTLTREELAEINALPQTWAEIGDVGHGRNGSSVSVMCEAGQTLSQEHVETVFAPLTAHILGYFSLVNRSDLPALQEPGNFSSHLASQITVIRDEELR